MPSAREGDRLAVEDELLRRQRLQGLDDLGHRGGHLLQRAGVDLDLAARLVHLHARAVDLPFERGGAELGHRRGDVVGGRGQHRLHRPVQGDGEAGEGGGAVFAHRHARGLAQAAGEHRRAAHVGRGQAGGGGDGVEHHALERALAQLADQQADEEVLLGGGGAGEEGRELGAARGGRALAGGGGDVGEGGVDLAQGQRGRRRGRTTAQRRQGRPADADPALADLAREPGDRDLHLVGRGAAQAGGDGVALGEAARGRGGLGGGVDEGGEGGGHRRILASSP